MLLETSLPSNLFSIRNIPLHKRNHEYPIWSISGCEDVFSLKSKEIRPCVILSITILKCTWL